MVLAGMFLASICGLAAHDRYNANARPRARARVATLRISIHDGAGAPLPGRLTFRGVGATRTPAFTTTDIGREEIGCVTAFDRAFVLRGECELHIEPGMYDVFASHGPEWDSARQFVVVAPGDSEVSVKLHHVIETPGWITGDFHVHAAASLDSRVPMRDRVHQFVADDVDLIVSTDHNVIADYAPVITELGVSDLLASATGDEITTATWGHFGAFPLAPIASEVGNGAPVTGSRTPAEIFKDLRRSSPAALIDVHHPRLEKGDVGYFHLAGVDSSKHVANREGFSLDFDAVEVLNGYQDPDHATIHKVVEDWIALLDSGKRVAATGNSDTHHLKFNLGGYPRNYVALADKVIDPAKVAAAVKAGHSYFTTGPIIDATIGFAGFGDTISVKGTVQLAVRVRAAPWISANRLTILGPGGAVLASRVLSATTNVVRFDGTIPLEISRDGYVIVHVDGDVSMAPNVGDTGTFQVLPFALTNPIWIDADADGKITPSAPRLMIKAPGPRFR